jgi:hypothetical protein
MWRVIRVRNVVVPTNVLLVWCFTHENSGNDLIWIVLSALQQVLLAAVSSLDAILQFRG